MWKRPMPRNQPLDRPSARPPTWSRVRSALKQIVGMPDYPRYLEHAASHHPGSPALTEREFYDQYLATRYGAGPTRCC